MRKLVTAFVAVATLSAAAPVFAADAAWSDGEFLRAHRCLGLAQSTDLGVVDTAALKAQIKAEGRSRSSYVLGRAEAARVAGVQDGHTRSEAVKAKLLAERDSVCKTYLDAQVAAN